MRLTVYEYDPTGDGASDYTAFTEEVAERLELAGMAQSVLSHS